MSKERARRRAEREAAAAEERGSARQGRRSDPARGCRGTVTAPAARRSRGSRWWRRTYPPSDPFARAVAGASSCVAILARRRRCSPGGSDAVVGRPRSGVLLLSLLLAPRPARPPLRPLPLTRTSPPLGSIKAVQLHFLTSLPGATRPDRSSAALVRVEA